MRVFPQRRVSRSSSAIPSAASTQVSSSFEPNPSATTQAHSPPALVQTSRVRQSSFTQGAFATPASGSSQHCRARASSRSNTHSSRVPALKSQYSRYSPSTAPSSKFPESLSALCFWWSSLYAAAISARGIVFSICRQASTCSAIQGQASQISRRASVAVLPSMQPDAGRSLSTTHRQSRPRSRWRRSARQTHAPIDCLPKPCLRHLASARPSENPNCSLGQAGGTCEGREHLVSPGQEVKPLAPRPENLLETLYVFASQPLGQLVCEFE